MCRFDVFLGDPIQALSPASIKREIRTGMGTTGRVRLDDQEVALLSEGVVHDRPPSEVERNGDRHVRGVSVRITELVTRHKNRKSQHACRRGLQSSWVPAFDIVHSVEFSIVGVHGFTAHDGVVAGLDGCLKRITSFR
jgi:hypothetical protein